MLKKTVTIDKTVIKRFYNDSLDDFTEMLTEFTNNKNGILKSLKLAYKEGILPLQKSIYAHSSIFCFVGFPKLTTVFLQFEALCNKTSDIKQLKQPFEEILIKFNDSILLAENELKKLEQHKLL